MSVIMTRIKPKKLTSPDDSSYVCELMRWMFAETCHFFYQSSVFCYKFILRHQVLTFINMVVLSVNLIFIWGFRKWRSRKVHHLPSTLSDRTSSCNKLLRRLQSKAYSGETYLKKTRLRNIHGTGCFMKTYDYAPASAGDYVTADCDVGRRRSSTQQTSGDHDETLDEITWGFDTSPMLSYHPPPETDHAAKQESVSSADGVSQRTTTTQTKKRNPKCELKRKKVIAKKKIAHVDSAGGRRERRKNNKIVIDKLVSGASPEHRGGSPTKVKKQLTPRVPIGRSVKSQCPQLETTSSKRSSALQEVPARRPLDSRTVSPKKSVKKSFVLRPPQDPVVPRVSISPEKFFLQNKAVHETDLSSESEQAEKVPALQGLTVDSRSEASNVCKRDSWIWFSREARPSMENFASRQRKFKSEDPRVAELAAEIRRQDEMNRDIEREAESLIESSSQSNKIASTKWVQQPIGPGLQTASRIRARGRVRPSPYARHNTNPTVSRKSREPERKLLSSARKHLSPQKYLVHFLKNNAIDNQKLRADVKTALRNADISFTSSEGDVISHTRVATPWDPEPTYAKVPSPHPSGAHDQPGELLNSPLAGPYESLTARKLVTTCGRQSPPNDNSALLSSLDSSLTFQQPAPLVKVDAHAEDRFSRSFSLTPAQEIPPVLFNVQNSIGSSPFRNHPHGRRPHATGMDPRQVYSATARTQSSFQNQIIQTQGRAKMEKRVHLSAGDSESDSLQREISVQDSTLRQVLITKEVNTAIHRLLFDTEQSSSSLSPSSFNKQSAVSRGITPREISAITYACHPAEGAPGQKTCGVKNNVSIQFSVQANPQESSSFKSDSAIRSKRTNIYNPDYYLGKRVTCKRQLTATNQTESTTESSSNRWRKKSRPRADVNSPVVYSSEHSTPTPLLPKSTGDSVIEKAQLLNQRRPEAVRATPMSGPTQQYHTDSASDLSLGRQDAVPRNVEETTSTENQFSAPRKSSIPILNRCGGDSQVINNQLSGAPEHKKQTHEPPAKADTPSNNLNQRSNLVQESVPRWNAIKESGTQSNVCLSVNQPFQQRIHGQAGHTRKPSRSHEVILPCNTMPNKVINIGLRSKPLDFSNRPNKPDIISLQDFATRVSPSETSHMFRPGGACDVYAPTAFPANDRSHSAASANDSIQASTADEKQAGSDDAARLASDVRLKPQKVVTYSDSYWARKVAAKQTPPDGPQKSPSLVLGKSESCHSLKSSLPKPLRVSSSSDHVGVPTKPAKSAMGVSGLCSHVMTGSTNNSSSNAPYQRVGESKAVPPTMVGHFFFVTATTATSDKPPVYPDDSFLNAGNIGTVGDRKGLENISNYRTDLDLVNKNSGDGDALVSNLTRKTGSPKMCSLNMLKGASTPCTDSQPREEDIKPGARSTWTDAGVDQQRAEAVDSKNSCSSDDTEPSQMVLPPTSSDDDDDFDTNDIVENTRSEGSRGERFLPTAPFIQEDQSKQPVAPTLSNQDSGYEESMSDQAQKTKKTSDDISGPQPKSPTETAVTDSSSSCSEGSHNSEGFTNVSRTSEECDSETQWMSSRTDNAFVSPRHSTASTSSRLSKFTISKSQRPRGVMSRECASAALKSPTRDVQNRLSESNVFLLCDGEHDKYSDWLSSGATSEECRASVYAREGNSEAPSTYLTKGLERVKINKIHADSPPVEAAGAHVALGYVQASPLLQSNEMAAKGASSGSQPRCAEDRLSQKTHVNDLRRPNTLPDCITNCVPSKIRPNYHPVDGGKDNTSPEFSERRENMQDASCSTTADVRMLDSLLSSELGEPCRDDSPGHSSNTSLDLSTSFGLSTFEESDTRHTADTFGDTFVKGMNRADLVPNGGSCDFDASHILDPFTYSVSQTANQKRDATSVNIILLPPTSSDEEDGECPKTYDCGGDREKTEAAGRPISSMARPSTSRVHSMSPLLSRDHASDSLLGKTCPEQRADNSCSTDVRKRELIPKRSVNFEELLKRF